MGFVDTFKILFFAFRAMDDMVELSFKADKVLLIDAPAFNLALAKKIKEKYPSKEIIYYILPKAWAWKKNRIKKVELYCDKQISIFPFEKKYFKQSVYFGNPLMDEIKKYNDDYKAQEYIAFLAGSRKTEIKLLMPIFRNLALKIKEKCLLSIPLFFTKQEIDLYYGDISMFEISRDTNEALIKSKFAYICSGTASLEASIIGTPFVLVYKAKFIDYVIFKLLNIKYIGLANIILNELGYDKMHPEVLQKELDIDFLIDCKMKYNYDDFTYGVRLLRENLENNCSKRVMQKILE